MDFPQRLCTTPHQPRKKRELTRAVELLKTKYGGGIEPHRLLSAPSAVLANVFTSLTADGFTVNGFKMSTIVIGTIALSFAGSYDRKDLNYRSYKPNTSTGFYTNKACDFINIDHIVSLKDAYESGASSWAASRKKAFANDRSNHVPSCGRVNSSKGSEGPSDFLRRSRDGRGLEYNIVRFCEYVHKYYTVKVNYGLSLVPNDKKVFRRCDRTI